MTATAQPGPLVVYGQNPAQSGTAYQPDYNGDAGPSLFYAGIGLLDPRYGYRAGLQSLGRVQSFGWLQAPTMVINQVPSQLQAANIAAAANVTSGTAMTLVSSTGAGITVSSAAVKMYPSLWTLPAGTLFIDGAPALVTYGQNGALAVMDPRFAIGRAVSITGSLSATGGAFKVAGYDVYGYAMNETITVGAGAVTQNGKKAFKAIVSVTPQFTDAHNYSVGTADIFGFPLAAYDFGSVEIVWNSASITASTGFTAADANTATATTGDVRGTYAVQSASDGTKRLVVTVTVLPDMALVANGARSLYGMAQF